jgi:pimeloyl-ACP methyl ester carboxylesterase
MRNPVLAARLCLILALALTLDPVASPAWGAEEVTLEGLEYGGEILYMRTAGPEDGPSVLLLHGAKYHSGTWEKLGTLQRLAGAGYRVVALDLPGYGRSRRVRARPDAFLVGVLPKLDIGRPIVVSPSMSGRFSFPLLIEHPDWVAGFVPVAPVGALDYAKRNRNSSIPTLVIWGEKDRLFPPLQAQVLADSFKDSKVLILPGAGHPAYLDQPEAFHQALLEFAAGPASARSGDPD